MGFCPVCWGNGELCNLSPINFDLIKHNALAEKFTKDEVILEYIKSILVKSDFQADPKKYLEDWKVRRGYTEECRFPEDYAMRFFHIHFGR